MPAFISQTAQEEQGDTPRPGASKWRENFTYGARPRHPFSAIAELEDSVPGPHSESWGACFCGCSPEISLKPAKLCLTDNFLVRNNLRWNKAQALALRIT